MVCDLDNALRARAPSEASGAGAGAIAVPRLRNGNGSSAKGVPAGSGLSLGSFVKYRTRPSAYSRRYRQPSGALASSFEWKLPSATLTRSSGNPRLSSGAASMRRISVRSPEGARMSRA